MWSVEYRYPSSHFMAERKTFNFEQNYQIITIRNRDKVFEKFFNWFLIQKGLLSLIITIIVLKNKIRN